MVTDEATKRRVVWAAVQLLKRAGMDVTETEEGAKVTLLIDIPPDSGDPHGDRLKAAINP